ncbi:MAG: hypothetical protein WAW96_02870 [Alphaproteobacteria bacterium]
MTEYDLDKALMAPLPEIADGGFSQAVLVQAIKENARRERNVTIAVAGSVALLCAMMPLTKFGQAVDQWAIGFGRDLSGLGDKTTNLWSLVGDTLNFSSLSLPLAITVGALTLAMLVAQAFPARR